MVTADRIIVSHFGGDRQDRNASSRPNKKGPLTRPTGYQKTFPGSNRLRESGGKSVNREGPKAPPVHVERPKGADNPPQRCLYRAGREAVVQINSFIFSASSGDSFLPPVKAATKLAMEFP